jgi:hypothetical protein
MLEMLVACEYMLPISSTKPGWQSNNADIAVFIGVLWVSQRIVKNYDAEVRA